MDLMRQKYGLDLSDMDRGPIAGWAFGLAGLALLVLGAARRSSAAVSAGAAVLGGTLVYRAITQDEPGMRTLPRRARGGYEPLPSDWQPAAPEREKGLAS